jgi:S-(hydroxymethyl)glutathione dehydrogenase / alcohol dehydrogenase
MGIETFFPIIGGHEGAGVVVEVGPGVTSVQPATTSRPVVHPELRSLPLLLHRPAEPVRPRGRARSRRA